MKNLTTQQVMQLAGVSHMTVYTWRLGTPTKTALPAEAGDKPRSVEFDARKLKAWAFDNGVTLTADPVALATGKLVATPAGFKPASPKASKQDQKASKRKQLNNQKARH